MIVTRNYHLTGALLNGMVIHLGPPPPLGNSDPSIVITHSLLL